MRRASMTSSGLVVVVVIAADIVVFNLYKTVICIRPSDYRLIAYLCLSIGDGSLIINAPFFLFVQLLASYADNTSDTNGKVVF